MQPAEDDRSGAPEPPPELLAAMERFRREHASWGSFDAAWDRAEEAPHAMLAAAAAQGAMPPGARGGAVEAVGVFGGSASHLVTRVGGWLVDTTARKYRPLDPVWPRPVAAQAARRHYSAEEFVSPWAPTPCGRREAVEWARGGRMEVVPDVPLLHIALADRRLRERPTRAVVLLSLPRDGAASPPSGRAAEVSPVWRHYDEDSAAAATHGVARMAGVARALGFASVVGYAEEDPLPDPSWPWGHDPEARFERGRGWVAEEPGVFPTFLRPTEGRKGAAARATRRAWDAEAHELAVWRYDEEVRRREEELGRELDDEESSAVAFDLGMYDHASLSWAPPRAVGRWEDVALVRHRLEFRGRRGPLGVVPLSRGEAHAFVDDHHSHLRAPLGESFALGVEEGGELRCALTFGRPEARLLQEAGPWVGEVTRVACAPGGGRREGGHASNWASRALGAALEVATLIGVTRVVSYTNLGEGGGSYMAAGYAPCAITRGGEWGRGARPRAAAAQPGRKVRWEVGADAALPGGPEARRIVETVRAARGAPVPPRPPPRSDRYVARREGPAWVVHDVVAARPASGPLRRAEAEAFAARREAARRAR